MFGHLLLAYLCWTLIASEVHGFSITNDPSHLLNQTFDYIIVGGGTAGLTVANRLTEDKRISVLVIEAGQDKKNDKRVTDPGNFALADVSDLRWGYMITNQSVGGKAQELNVGKVLGGSSAINGMQWTRGTIGQYDALEDLGNAGWNFANLQKYMKKAEAFHAPNAAQLSLGVEFLPDAHGTSGHVVTGFPNPYPCPSCTVWDKLISSATRIFPNLRTTGVDQCSGDPRGAARCSYSIIPGSTTSNGRNVTQNARSSSVQSYVYSLPPSERPNLHILVEHQAVRIVWDTKSLGNEPRPKSVEIRTQGSPSLDSFTVNVAKEVIVSSGTLGTPKFLELSGIGNRRLLENLGIPVIADLPAVGTNFQDQSLISLTYNTTPAPNTPSPHAPVTGAALFLTLDQILGTKAANAYVQGLKTSLAQRAKDIVAAGAGVQQEGMKRLLEAQVQQFGDQEVPVVEIVYAAIQSQHGIGAITWILIPQSRGTVHISSPDPESPPAINPNYLDNSYDLSLLTNASIATRRIFSVPAAQTLYSSELMPGAAVQTDDQWSAYVTDNYMPVAHSIGTASMLPRDLGGVVDDKLRVYGVQGVRVVDASILPLQISAHLSSTVYGIAEKAADIIKGI